MLKTIYTIILIAMIIPVTYAAGIKDATDFGYCVRAVDGDTLIVVVNGKNERVRLIGVDTPETKHPRKPVEYYGKEASRFTKEAVAGQDVFLKYDWQKRDKFNRLLAYVYRAEDDFFLNLEIIKQGYGHAYTKYPFRHMDDFRKAELEARKGELGLWKK